MSYVDGRIHEVAHDSYAQADDGAVWFFGEDVFRYEDGVVLDKEGTWYAGKDGPSVIMRRTGLVNYLYAGGTGVRL